MKISNEKQIFNLMDTNGRRNDVVNALQGYLPNLADFNGEWDNLPNSIENNDLTWIQNNQDSYRELLDKFDQGIEDRARHYTSNLGKLRLTTQKREITNVGQLLL